MPAKREYHDKKRHAGDQIAIEGDLDHRVILAQQFGEHVHDCEHEKTTYCGNHAEYDMFIMRLCPGPFSPSF